MSCDSWLEAISARADHEPLGLDEHLLDAHLETCPSCRTFAAHTDALRRKMRVTPAPEIPDLSRQVVKLNSVADRVSRWGIARAFLALLAIETVILSIPALVLGHDGGGSPHAARHLGAFTVAYAAGLFVVVIRPSRARAILPVAFVLATALTITAIVDVAEGHIPLLGEAVHIPELLSVLLVWLIARPVPQRAVRPGVEPQLNLVEEPEEQHRRDAG